MRGLIPAVSNSELREKRQHEKLYNHSSREASRTKVYGGTSYESAIDGGT